MLPATKLYSDRSRAPDATHEVSREHEYKDATDPDALVPPEERQKAYKVASLLPCAVPHALLALCYHTLTHQHAKHGTWERRTADMVGCTDPSHLARLTCQNPSILCMPSLTMRMFLHSTGSNLCQSLLMMRHTWPTSRSVACTCSASCQPTTSLSTNS